MLVAQAEIPLDALVAAASTANDMGCRVVLNLAPFQRLPEDVLRICDPLVVNEGEARAMLGVGEDAELAPRAMATLLPSRSAVVTLGGRGAMLSRDDIVEHVAAPAVPVVDSTGAGDAFTGAIAASLSRGDDLPAAVRFAVEAGAQAVGALGARASYPATPDLAGPSTTVK